MILQHERKSNVVDNDEDCVLDKKLTKLCINFKVTLDMCEINGSTVPFSWASNSLKYTLYIMKPAKYSEVDEPREKSDNQTINYIKKLVLTYQIFCVAELLRFLLFPDIVLMKIFPN